MTFKPGNFRDLQRHPESIRPMVNAYLDRISARDEQVKAWAWHDKQQVLEQLDKQLKNASQQPLMGIPIGIKDIIDTAEMPTEYGSKAYQGNRPVKDALIVNKLKHCGAIIMGKTVTTEFAYTHPGPTTHPHRSTHSPGGSSSGSAAAVADGMVPVAIGTQTGGSVLRPSSYCGIVGFKPTYGLLAMDGVMPFSRTLDTLGLHARDVQDIAIVFQALTDTPNDTVNQAFATLSGKQHIRLAWFPGYDAPMANEDAIRVLCDTRDQWSSRAKLSIEAINLSERLFSKLGQANHIIMMFEGAKVHQLEYESKREQLGQATIEMIEEGMQISETTYQEALLLAQSCRAEYQREMQGFDGLLTFSAPGEAPLWEKGTGSGIFNRLWTTIGSPAITLPTGKGQSGLPIGVQVVGHHYQDWALLALAAHLNQV